MTLKASLLGGGRFVRPLNRATIVFAPSLALLLSACIDSPVAISECAYADTDETGASINRTLGQKRTGKVLYFEDLVPFDKHCSALFPVADYKGHTEPEDNRTDDTERVQRALFAASQIDRDEDGTAEGGVVYLKKSQEGGSNIYRLSRLNVPSNIRVVVDPEVTLMMIGGSVTRRSVEGDLMRDKDGEVLKRHNQHMFAIGNSEFTTELNPNRTKNVEVTSARAGEMFTIDQRTEFPTVYTIRRQGNLRSGKTAVTFDNPQEYGITSEFAAPFFIGYAKNISVSDVDVLDNYTYLPPVAVFPDSDMQDGILEAKRHVGKKSVDANGHELLPRMLVDDEGNKVTDVSAYERNPTYGRVLTQGAFVNIRADRGHGGFGVFQLWGGDTVYAKDLHGTGGITVRLEPGAGIENISRSGPEYGTIHTVEIENISIRDGYSALWLNPHSKDNYGIKAKNLSAYDSGAVVIMDKSSQDNSAFPDLYQGKFTDVKISGDIYFARENEEPRAEVGFIPTLAMHPDTISAVTDTDGYTNEGIRSAIPDGKITTTDLPAGPSGDRWFMTDPIIPVIAFNQMPSDYDRDIKVDNLYNVDFSEATFRRGGDYPILHETNIAYRTDMRRLWDGKPALDRIKK